MEKETQFYPTEQQIANLYARAVQVAKEVYGIDSDEVHMDSDSITVKEWNQRCQDYDYVAMYINGLATKSLDEWETRREEQAIKEEEERLQRIADKERADAAQQEKKEREEYERLKQKFE